MAERFDSGQTDGCEGPRRRDPVGHPVSFNGTHHERRQCGESATRNPTAILTPAAATLRRRVNGQRKAHRTSDGVSDRQRQGVELLMAYSNQTYVRETIAKLGKLTPAGGSSRLAAKPSQSQQQCRLPTDEVHRLVEAYRQGAGTTQLGRDYSIHRTTVWAHLERAGIARRPAARKLTVGRITTPRRSAGAARADAPAHRAAADAMGTCTDRNTPPRRLR